MHNSKTTFVTVNRSVPLDRNFGIDNSKTTFVTVNLKLLQHQQLHGVRYSKTTFVTVNRANTCSI